MRYLITGGCGFIGSNLTKHLITKGHVTIIDNLCTGNLENIKPYSVKFIQRDVREDLSDLGDFDIIFHLAALARIQPSFYRPQETYSVNSSGTMNILEFARQGRVGKIVYAGSSTFYNGPHANPYAYSKWLGEQHCLLYSKIYGLKTSAARFFNVYGPNQPEEGEYATVIGIFKRQKELNIPLTITGDGSKRRDFTHVDDICSGLVKIGETDTNPEDVFCLGTGKNHSILDVAKMFKHNYIFTPGRRGEAQDTLADISLAQKVLGYQPQIQLEDYMGNK